MTNRIRVSLISISSLLLFYGVIGGVLGKNNGEKTYRDLGVYSEVLTRIKQEYVTEPNLSKVTKGAIRGLLEALDPYSTYFTPKEYQDYLERPEPGPADVGIFLSKRLGYATIISVLPGSPAEKGGVKPGDLIDLVDGTATRELSVVHIQRLLAGATGTKVTITVVREARGEPQKLTLTRSMLNSPPAIAKMVDGGTAYVRVATFNKGKTAELSAKVKELTAGGAHKIVLDLRNCAGGDVQEAVDTASLFLDKGQLVTYLLGQRYPRQDLTSRPSGPVWKLPLAVLINQSTAGPAELVASAILANKRGEVVGVRSFGVGVFQKLVPVGDGSALLLSVAKYHSPDGKAISENGVTPSVIEPGGSEIASLDEETAPDDSERFGGKDDRQLRKALEILDQKYSPAKAA